jgi:uncharacterized membrane protein
VGEGEEVARRQAAGPYRPLLRALRRRRRLRASLVQLAYVVALFALSVALSHIGTGPMVPATTIVPMLFALAGALVSFIAIVYSLLFLVVQWASSAYSPRLHLFRDHPLVWHSFGFFAGTIAYCIAGGLALGDETQVSLAVPAGALLLILIALALFRSLQSTALGSIQLAPTLETIASRGRLVLDAVYSTQYSERGADAGADLPPVIAEAYWKAPPRVLQQVNLPKLVRLAERAGAVVVLEKQVSEQLVERGLVARVHASTPGLSEAQILGTLTVGAERTFDQDPLLAFRLLADIALRALSPAINDPTTAVQALDSIDGLIRPLCTRDLDVGHVAGADGHLRVILAMPNWGDFVALSCDEITLAARDAPAVLRRLEQLLAGLITLAPPARQPPLLERMHSLGPVDVLKHEHPSH